MLMLDSVAHKKFFHSRHASALRSTVSMSFQRRRRDMARSAEAWDSGGTANEYLLSISYAEKRRRSHGPNAVPDQERLSSCWTITVACCVIWSGLRARGTRGKAKELLLSRSYANQDEDHTTRMPFQIKTACLHVGQFSYGNETVDGACCMIRSRWHYT